MFPNIFMLLLLNTPPLVESLKLFSKSKSVGSKCAGSPHPVPVRDLSRSAFSLAGGQCSISPDQSRAVETWGGRRRKAPAQGRSIPANALSAAIRFPYRLAQRRFDFRHRDELFERGNYSGSANRFNAYHIFACLVELKIIFLRTMNWSGTGVGT